MYSSYSPLQRRQLREQTYTDTQSTYLLVYAPGRRNALTLSLARRWSTHWKTSCTASSGWWTGWKVS